jgi:hypothetical protein
MYNFLETNKLLSSNQFGFRSNIGTEDAIMKLTSQIHSLIDNDEKPLAIFLDLAKAFDTVSHQLLFIKLNKIGIRGLALDLIKSYLEGRNQFVNINNCLSKPRIIKYGVPQGTVLGPLLFLVFINDLCSLKINCDITTFADDTVLLFSSKTWKSTHEIANTGLAKIIMWLNDNLLTLNNEKTNYITFSPRTNSQPINSSIKIHKTNCDQMTPCICYALEKSSSTRYLGIVIDQHLKWKDHIQTIVKKLRYILLKFYNIRSILSLTNLKMVYYALVQSVIQYGITGWGGAYDTHVQSLSSIQNIILKVIHRKDIRDSNFKLYDNAGVFQIRKLYAQFVIQFIYVNKLYTNQNVTPSSNIITRSKTRNNLYIPKVKKGISQRHASYIGPKIFNAIPDTIRQIKTKKSFKYYAKQWLKQYPIDFLIAIINTK